MIRFSILISICLALISCSKVETVTDTKAETLSSTPPQTTQIKAEIIPALKPVSPNIQLSSKRKKYLNESLPPKVREVLEKAEKFEILAEVKELDGGMIFEPNRIARVTDENLKKEILETFYNDAATDEPPAVCYIPHHAIRATYQGKTVEIEICFECARFFVESSFGKSEGTIVRENRKSEDIFNRIIQNQSIVLK